MAQNESSLDTPILSKLSPRDWVGMIVGLVLFGWGLNIYVETIRREIRAEVRQIVLDERERNAILYQPRAAGASKP